MYKKIIVNTTKITSLFAVALSLNVSAETCDINANIIEAHYIIETESNIKTKASAGNQKMQLDLVRNNNQVAYVYPHNNVTDVWVKYPNNQVALNRYFEEQKRSIEYQPTELKRKVNWQTKYQLITPTQIKEMSFITKAGSGCYQQEEYQLTKEGINVRLTWLPQLNLLKRLQVTQNNYSKIWRLNNVESSLDNVNQFFANHYQYQSTDYSDIGDNESDPFLVKMINLGFIDHTPKGFYNSQGDNISPDHHRH